MGKKKKGQKQPPSTGYSAPELPDAEAPILAEPILKHSNNDLGTTESLRASRALDADGTRPALDVELTRENVEAEFDIELDEGNAHDEPGFNGNLEDLHANEETEEEGVFALEEVEHSTVEVAATTSSPRVPPPPESRQRSQVISMDYQENVSLSEAAFNVSKLSHALPTLPPSNVANRRKARSRPVANHSIISQIGSLVKGTISHGTTSTSPVNAIPTTLNGPESIFFAKFVHLFCWDADAGGVNIADFTDDGNLCLVLGYERGFQIWSASSNGGNEFSQIASVRAGLSKIVDADVVSNSVSEIQREAIENHVAKECPIIVLVEATGDTQDPHLVRVYSLKSHQTVKSWNFKEQVISVKCSSRLIVVALSESRLHVYSALTLELISTISDAHPLFDAGTRLLVYASTSNAPKAPKVSDTPVDPYDEWNMFSQAGLSHKRDSTVGDKAIDGIKRATGKVVKEVMSGATYLGAMGLAAAKNYLQSGTNGAAASSVHIDVQGPDGSPEEGSERTTGDWRAEGVVAIRSFSLDSHFTPGVDASNAGDPSDLISHWKVHSNRISNLTLNHAQTLLFTSSTSANTFLIFSLAVPAPVQHNRRILTPQQCLYKLERGFTPATIESVSFSANGKWCAVSTARGTTHMYALPPVSAAFGGSRDFEKQYELGVLNGWTDAKAGNAEVVNAALRAVGGGAGNGGDGIVLYPAARIKQTVTFGGDGEGIVEGKDVHVDAVVSGRSALCVGFFLDRVPATASVPVANSVRKSNGAGIMGGGSPSLTGFLTGPSEADYSRLFRQRVLSMHPCGFVTLHHVDLGVYLNGDGASPVSLSSSFGTSPRFSSSASPRDASWNGLHQHLHGMPKVMVKDVMQWDIKRSENWSEYKPVLEMSLEKKGPWKSGNWASQIETNSYDTVLFGPPIWMDPLIKLHFYVDDEIDSPSEPIKLPTPDLSDLPRFRLLEVRRELSKPYGSKAEVFPSLRDSQFVENDMTDAMTDIGTPGSLTPVWRKEGVSFDDALVVDEEPLLSPTNQLSESVQFGYLNKLSSKFKQ